MLSCLEKMAPLKNRGFKLILTFNKANILVPHLCILHATTLLLSWIRLVQRSDVHGFFIKTYPCISAYEKPDEAWGGFFPHRRHLWRKKFIQWRNSSNEVEKRIFVQTYKHINDIKLVSYNNLRGCCRERCRKWHAKSVSVNPFHFIWRWLCKIVEKEIVCHI